MKGKRKMNNYPNNNYPYDRRPNYPANRPQNNQYSNAYVNRPNPQQRPMPQGYNRPYPQRPQGYAQQPYAGAAAVQEKSNTGLILGIIGGVVGIVMLAVIIVLIATNWHTDDSTTSNLPNFNGAYVQYTEFENTFDDMEEESLDEDGNVLDDKIDVLLQDEYNYIYNYNDTHHIFEDVKINDAQKTIDCIIDDDTIFRHVPGKNGQSGVVDNDGNAKDDTDDTDTDDSEAAETEETEESEENDSNIDDLDSAFRENLCSEKWYMNTIINGGCGGFSFEFSEDGTVIERLEGESETIENTYTFYADGADCATWNDGTDTFYVYNNEYSNNVFTYESDKYKGIICRASKCDSSCNDYSILSNYVWYSEYFEDKYGTNESVFGEVDEDEKTLAFYTDGEYYSESNMSGSGLHEDVYHFYLTDSDLSIFFETDSENTDRINAFIFDGDQITVEQWKAK